MPSLPIITAIFLHIIICIQPASCKLISIGEGVIDVPEAGDQIDGVDPSWTYAIDALYLALQEPLVADFEVAAEFAGHVVDDSLVCDMSVFQNQISAVDTDTLLFTASIAYLAGRNTPGSIMFNAGFIIWVVEHHDQLAELLRKAPEIRWTPLSNAMPDRMPQIRPLPSVHQRLPTDMLSDNGKQQQQQQVEYDGEIDSADDDIDDDDTFDDDGDDDDDENMEDLLKGRIGKRVRSGWWRRSWIGYRHRSAITFTILFAAIVFVIALFVVCFKMSCATNMNRQQSLQIDPVMLYV